MDFNRHFASDLSRNLAASLPSTDEIIRAIGLQARRSNASEVVPSVALFGAGLLVGAGLALLFAPTTGRELRDGITEKAGELRDRASAALESGQEAPSDA